MTRREASFCSGLIVGVFVAALIFTGVSGASAQTETTLYSFGELSSPDGHFPNGPLVSDSHGSLYGTTAQGGVGEGVVFKLDPPAISGGAWTETLLFADFSGINGVAVQGGLARNSQTGKLYGVTASGGLNGFGVVFELAPPARPGSPWTEAVLYNFTGGDDGSYGTSGLVADTQGRLYGEAGGGRHHNGVVFVLLPPPHPGGAWSEKVLYSFLGKGDGVFPFGGLTLDNAGAIYGITLFGGTGRFGSVFQLTPPSANTGKWTENLLYSFTGGNDGKSPKGSLIVDGSGRVYGTTTRGGNGCAIGCGTVYQLTPPITESAPWTETVLYAFTDQADGESPSSGLTFGPGRSLFGTNRSGRGDYPGTVFQLTPPDDTGPWTFTFFGGLPPAHNNSIGPVLLLGNKLFGTTAGGGNGETGTVFEISQ